MSQNKVIVASIVGTALLIGGALYATSPKKETNDGYRTFPRATTNARDTARSGTATVQDGVQYVDIDVRGGYFPQITKAQAGIPTVLRMKTDNTYDCSIALVINDLGYRSFLPGTGITEIEVPTEKAQGTLRGMCSMAMYHFQVDFESSDT